VIHWAVFYPPIVVVSLFSPPVGSPLVWSVFPPFWVRFVTLPAQASPMKVLVGLLILQILAPSSSGVHGPFPPPLAMRKQVFRDLSTDPAVARPYRPVSSWSTSPRPPLFSRPSHAGPNCLPFVNCPTRLLCSGPTCRFFLSFRCHRRVPVPVFRSENFSPFFLLVLKSTVCSPFAGLLFCILTWTLCHSRRGSFAFVWLRVVSTTFAADRPPPSFIST